MWNLKYDANESVYKIETDSQTPRTKEKLQQDGRRGAVTLKSNPIPIGGGDHIWRTILPKKFSHCWESSRHNRLPKLRIRLRGWEYPGNLILKASGFDYRTSKGPRINGDSWYKQNLVCTRNHGKGAHETSFPHETEPDPPASV